ncbi:repulsive guidance molecule A-like isoform X2 [Eublepharis macularius]|uniref:Repulsive guidance molecule A-like isoform X2 n=1 Tax=Eublepharis macularius TaxID=481883 RepID=A0AA97JEF8_EUBMA|nr:repulsive guidance molecule A-like isoform X2 [Eublepharis macularius]
MGPGSLPGAAAGGRLRGPRLAALLALCCWGCLPRVADCQPCRIQRCNADYVAATSPVTEETVPHVDYCIALRAYSLCTRKMARLCRGDLVYHSAVFRIKELFGQHNCSSDGPTSSARAGAVEPLVSEICNYRARSGFHTKFAHCGLFGDPHLRTFKDEFQTCKVEGAWPLIDNQYLSVQVTNVPVGLGSGATATSKITLIFKSFPGCSEQKVYQATTEDLPLAFTDGTRNGGLQEGLGSLQILEKPDVRQVEIQAHHIGSTVIIRQVGRYLTFAIRVPEDILGTSELSTNLQLCLQGCPQNELIQEHWLSPASSDLLRPSSRQAYTVESATEQCSHLLPVEDMYFQSCVFDLLTTGDSEFSVAAYGALEDMKALNPSRLQLHPASKAAHSAGRRPSLGQRAAVLLPGLLVFLLLPIQC